MKYHNIMFNTFSLPAIKFAYSSFDMNVRLTLKFLFAH